MVTRSVVCAVLFYFTAFKIEANFFIANKKCENTCDTENYFCITNTSFALSWNYPENGKYLIWSFQGKEILFTWSYLDFVKFSHEVSTFTPKPKQRDFDCEIKHDIKTKHFVVDPWRLTSSFNESILDERWEAIETVKTEFIPVSHDTQPLEFKHVLNISTQNFEIFFSIRTEREAHIFLCGGENVSQSNCYWVMLEAFSGNGSAIRKCPNGSIPSVNNKWVSEPCKTPLVNISHPTVPRYLSSKQWNHFIISKRDETLSFKKAHTHQTDSLLNLKVTEEPIDIKHMIVHSKQVIALWKIHKLDYLYTNSESPWTKIGPAILVEEDSICVSMYVSMCPSCHLKLVLAKGSHKIINERIFNNSEQTGWFKIKYITDNLQKFNGQKVKLAVSTANSNQNGLWRIDNIRLCKREEFRMIGLSKKASCQMMSNTNDIIDFKEDTQVSVFKNHCPEDTIGSFCMRCNLTFEDCKNIKICTKDECTCSAGYQGKNCQDECKSGYYGHGCNKQCGKCNDNCDNINGTCTSCKEGNTGARCDIQTTKIFKLKATARSSTTIKLQWTPPGHSYGAFQSYIVKYKHTAYMGCENESPSSPPENKEEVTGTSLTLRDLIPFSEYNVTILAKNSKIGLNESLMVTTDPEDEIGPEETPKIFNITESENEAYIELSRNCGKIRGPLILNVSSSCTSFSCAEQNRVSKIFQSKNTKLFSLKRLIPFSDYTVEVKYCRYGSCSQSDKGTFKTKPTVPGKVKNLLIYTKNSTSISLRWEPPYPLTGILKNYKVDYYTGSKQSKKNLLFNVTRCNLWPNLHCAILTNLQTQKLYTIEVSAENEMPEKFGVAVTALADTKSEPSQAPYDLYARWTPTNDLNLEWKHPDETNGDIQYFKIVIDNPNKKAVIDKKFQVSEETYNLTYYYQINSTAILPTTDYTISVNPYNGQDGYPASISTQSPPDLPMLTSEPEFNICKVSISTTLKLNNLRGQSSSYRLFVLKSDENSNLSDFQELEEFDLRNLRVVVVCNVSSVQYMLKIGQNQNNTDCEDQSNSAFDLGTTYNITVIVINTFNSIKRSNMYTYSYRTRSCINPSLFGLLILLLIIPIVVILYKRRSSLMYRIQNTGNLLPKKRQRQPSIETEEQIELTDKNKPESNIEKFSKQIPSGSFNNYVKMSLQKQEFQQQHKAILNTISTYQTVRDSLRLEYLDMNYITGLQIRNAFVVTKIPNATEIKDFWTIVWNDNIQNIVLLEDIHIIKDRFIRFWPEAGKNIQAGKLTVELIKCDIFENYMYRIFSLNSKNETRQVTQLHFSLTSNEDSCLLSSLTYSMFFKKVSEIPLCSKSPVLIHSSSGMHGNGFTLLCGISLRTAKKDGAVDVMADLKKITEVTPEMMIDYDYYELAHRIIADVINHMDTAVKCNSFEADRKLFSSQKLKEHLQYLKSTSWLDCNIKNVRDSNVYYKVVSSENKTVLLAPFCIDDDTYFRSEHFETVRVDGYRSPRKFLVTQQPACQHLKEFFTLIKEKKISLVISLNENLTSWLKIIDPVLNLDELAVKHKETKNMHYYDWITVELTSENMSRTIEILSFKNWSSSEVFLPYVSHFVKFFVESGEMVQKHDCVLVTCQDGITASGLYLAMFYIIQKIKAEEICDVCTAIRTIRRHFQYFLMGDKRYKFLVDASHAYLKEFSLYEVK